MPVDHREKAFEAAIEESLLVGGYAKTDPQEFDRERAVVLDDLCRAMDSQGSLAFIRHGFKCVGKPIRVAFFAPAHATCPNPSDATKQGDRFGGLLICAGAAFAALLLYHSTGVSQRGYNRYSLDDIPILFTVISPACLRGK